jgi:hypothetical protein
MKRIIVFAAMTSLLLFGTACGKVEEFFVEIQAAACVDQIIERRAAFVTLFVPNAAGLIPECDEVKLTKKIADGKWEATAYFSNGGKQDCIVYYDENEKICVSMKE